MKIEVTEEEVDFINKMFQTVKVNDIPVNLQSLFHVLNKINTPLPEENTDNTVKE
jgi:hypothetical protein